MKYLLVASVFVGLATSVSVWSAEKKPSHKRAPASSLPKPSDKPLHVVCYGKGDKGCLTYEETPTTHRK